MFGCGKTIFLIWAKFETHIFSGNRIAVFCVFHHTTRSDGRPHHQVKQSHAWLHVVCTVLQHHALNPASVPTNRFHEIGRSTIKSTIVLQFNLKPKTASHDREKVCAWLPSNLNSFVFSFVWYLVPQVLWIKHGLQTNKIENETPQKSSSPI